MVNKILVVVAVVSSKMHTCYISCFLPLAGTIGENKVTIDNIGKLKNHGVSVTTQPKS